MTGMTERMVGAPAFDGLGQSVDHVSRFVGLAVGNLYLMAAFCTLWEVIARYVFNAPTQWVFEVVMVLCASAWMLSAGFVTAAKAPYRDHGFLSDGVRSNPLVARFVCDGGWRLCTLYAGCRYDDSGH